MGLLFVGFFLLAISPSFCSAQHWSYGFQPGGKRDAETLRESFEEPFANKMDKPVELQYFRCNVPCQHPTLTGLKGAFAKLIEGENGGKDVLDPQKRNKEKNEAFSNKYGRQPQGKSSQLTYMD